MGQPVTEEVVVVAVNQAAEVAVTVVAEATVAVEVTVVEATVVEAMGAIGLVDRLKINIGTRSGSKTV